jgi:membrane dipeptidase
VDIPLNYDQPGLKGVSIAVFVPQGARSEAGYGKARTDADKKYRLIRDFAEKNPAQAALAYSPADVRRVAAAGKFAIVLSLLNAYPLVAPRASIAPRNELGERDLPAFQSDLNQIDEWHNRGVRILGFVHAGHNDWADSSRPNAGFGDRAEEHCGLSELGKKAVRRLNDLGVLIDVSQLSRHALEQVLSLTSAPVIEVQEPLDTSRNLSDRDLELIQKNGGVVQIAALQIVDAAPKPDDPYLPIELAPRLARAWGSEFVDLGRQGHVNVASGHGDWPEGERLLEHVLNQGAVAKW